MRIYQRGRARFAPLDGITIEIRMQDRSRWGSLTWPAAPQRERERASLKTYPRRVALCRRALARCSIAICEDARNPIGSRTTRCNAYTPLGMLRSEYSAISNVPLFCHPCVRPRADVSGTPISITMRSRRKWRRCTGKHEGS